MSDPLRSAKVKTDRADTHIKDLQAQIDAFYLDRNHTTIFFEENSPPGRKTAKAKLLKSLPDVWPAIVGDTVYNIRSSLDHLACALARHNGAESVRDVYFPFAGNVDEFKAEGTQRKTKKLSPDARQIIEDLQPYGGGNDLLYSINVVRNADTHVEIAPIASFHGSTGLKGRVKIRSAGTLDLLHGGMNADMTFDLFSLPMDADFEGHIDVSYGVAFGDVPTVKGEPLIARLRQMLDEVQGVILTCERRFFVVQ